MRMYIYVYMALIKNVIQRHEQWVKRYRYEV